MDIIARDVYQILLDKASKVFEGAVVAGGSVVDSQMGVKPKDVDIFVPCTSKTFINRLSEFNKEIQIDDLFDDNKDESFKVTIKHLYEPNNIKEVAPPKCFARLRTSNYQNPFIRDIFKARLNGMSVDIIPFWGYNHWPSMKKLSKEEFLKTLMDSFDYNICKAFFSLEDGLVTTEECTRDITNERATLAKLETWADLPKMMKRFERINEKYPNIRFHQELFVLKKPLMEFIKNEGSYL